MPADPTEGRLLELLARWDELRRQGVDTPAESLCRNCPELIESLEKRIKTLRAFEALQCETSELRDTAAGEASSGTAEGELLASTSSTAECISRFRILRFHARGGLGEVFVAHDEVLNREVALKEIAPLLARDAGRRARFMMEAEVTGNLEHPGIVPVYGLGTYADGRPFYAMRFVSGETFEKAIVRFHEKDKASQWNAGERIVAFRGLLGRLIDVANAVAYAHSRNVIHRDLKPGNVMLGPYGETLVVDWGLAKVSGGSDGAMNGPDLASPLGLYRAAGAIETEPGAAFGTPAYMSPEQASGGTHIVGPACDIYSLGATLYCLLTGNPPFRGGEALELLQRVQDGDFPKPRAVSPTTPAALEAICLKAMALRPQDRYDSARAMAEDIEHWLADERVSSYSEKRVERTARWLRRHRTWAQAAAVALVIVSLVSSTAAVLVDRAWRYERTARKQEQLALGEAESSFSMARDAVNRVLTNFAAGTLASIPEAEGIRRQVAIDAVEFNERFLRMRPRDPSVRSEAARVYREAGNINRMLGHFSEAVQAYTRCVNLLEQLIKDYPDKLVYRNQLAESLQDASAGLRMEGRPQIAEPFCRRALELADQTLGKSPAIAGLRATKADCLQTLAAIFVDTGRFAEAERAHEEAVGLRRPLLASGKARYIDEIVFAMALEDWGKSLCQGGKPKDAEPVIAEAINRLGPLKDGRLIPERLASFTERAVRDNATFILALAQTELGTILSRDPTRRSEADLAFKSSIDGLSELGGARATLPRRRMAFALAQIGRASLRASNGDATGAESELVEARKILQALTKGFPHNPRYCGTLGLALGQLGRLVLARKENAAGRAMLSEAIENHRKALEANPDSPADKEALARLIHETEAPKPPVAP
jgi:eukaryotic-like serine/threonine-protein kinase